MPKNQYLNSYLLRCILHVNLGRWWVIKYESWLMTNKLWVTRPACLNVSLDLNFVILIWLLQVHLAHYRFSSSFEVWIDFADGFWWQVLLTKNGDNFDLKLPGTFEFLIIHRSSSKLSDKILATSLAFECAKRRNEIWNLSDDFQYRRLKI